MALVSRLNKVHNGWRLFGDLTQLADLAMRMRRRGVRINPEVFQKHRKALREHMDSTGAAFAALKLPAELGASGMHRSLSPLFFNYFNIKPRSYSEAGAPQLDVEMLQFIKGQNGPAAPAAGLVIKFRQAAKLLSTYIDGLPVAPDGLVHPVWSPHRAITGRWGCADPNLMNQPDVMRDIFRAREGMSFVAADYTQLEIGVLALLSGDPLLLKWYADGTNFHLETARRLFGPHITKEDPAYKAVKSVNYGKIYGAGVETLWKTLAKKGTVLPISILRKAHAFFDEQHPTVKAWQTEQIRLAQERGYVEGPFSGRREWFHDGHAEPTKTMNFPIQETAGWIKNRAHLALDPLLRWDKGESILLDVHDEIVTEGPDVSRLGKLLKSAMEQTITHNGNTVTFRVNAEQGAVWGETMEHLEC